jgi:hypothetical protein
MSQTLQNSLNESFKYADFEGYWASSERYREKTYFCTIELIEMWNILIVTGSLDYSLVDSWASQ